MFNTLHIKAESLYHGPQYLEQNHFHIMQDTTALNLIRWKPERHFCMTTYEVSFVIIFAFHYAQFFFSYIYMVIQSYVVLHFHKVWLINRGGFSPMYLISWRQ